ncbi:hypothetical protein JB92DRAFT_3131278 [Gautieria morchelliformis]|nr:hypothetical protein JB92DRAFT_3131278 [Gautieria morchelliformis]
MLNTQGIPALTTGPSGPNVALSLLGEGAVVAATSFIPVWVDMLQAGTPLVAFLIFGTSKEFLNALMFWRWFNPTSILDTFMFRRRRSPTTQRASNAHGEGFDAESVVSGDSVLDIRQETKTTDGQ